MQNDQTLASPQTQVGFNWYRFLVRSLIAVVIFNIIAGLVTWYYIFPHLHHAA